MWNFVKVVDILEDLHRTLACVNDLDLLQNLHHDLGVQDGVGFLVCQLTAKQEAYLAELIEEFRKWKTVVHILLHLSQLGKFLNDFFEELLIIVAHLEVPDELWDHENFKRFCPVICLLGHSLLTHTSSFTHQERVIIIQIGYQLSTEESEDFPDLLEQTTILVNVLEDASCFIEGVLHQV